MNKNLKNKAEPYRKKERAYIVAVNRNSYVVSRILLDSKLIGHKNCYFLVFKYPSASDLGLQVGFASGSTC